jgi:hypothetical protein
MLFFEYLVRFPLYSEGDFLGILADSSSASTNMDAAFGEVSLTLSKILDVAISTPPNLRAYAPNLYIGTPPGVFNPSEMAYLYT